MSIASWTSPAASGSTFPISCAISSAMSSFWSASSCARRNRISPRRGAGTSRHSSYADFAASTAGSTSPGPERGKTPRASPFAGLVVSKVSPEAASTHSPPMKFLKVFVVVATAAILFSARHLLEVLSLPGRLEAGAGRCADREQERAVLERHRRAPDRGIGDGDKRHGRRPHRLPAEAEADGALDDDVELLLAALGLVVLGDEHRARVAAERIHAESAEAEVVLNWVPVEVVRVVGRHERQLVEPPDPVAPGGHALLGVLGRVGAREGAGSAPSPAVPDLALAARGAARTPVVSVAPVDDHRHVRVVLVVLDHLVEELVLELARDHAVDHPALDCREGLPRRQRARGDRYTTLTSQNSFRNDASPPRCDGRCEARTHTHTRPWI